MRETVTLIAALCGLLLTGYAALAVILLVRERTKDARVLAALDILERIVRALVAQAESRIVGPLKAPDQPGEWTPRAAERVKHDVLAASLAQLPDRNRTALEHAGMDPVALTDAKIEQAVLEIKASGAATPACPPVDAGPITPPETPRAKHQSVLRPPPPGDPPR